MRWQGYKHVAPPEHRPGKLTTVTALLGPTLSKYQEPCFIFPSDTRTLRLFSRAEVGKFLLKYTFADQVETKVYASRKTISWPMANLLSKVSVRRTKPMRAENLVRLVVWEHRVPDRVRQDRRSRSISPASNRDR